MKKKKKWIAGITGILTAAACFLSGCSPASAAQKAAPSPVDAAGADTDEMVFIGWNTDPNGNGTWYKENQNVGKLKDDLNLYAQWAKKVNDFDYTGKVQTFTAPADGTYKLETWGAEGGGNITYYGGKGGYSYGNVTLKKGQIVYIAVGEAGKFLQGGPTLGTAASAAATFNGGGRGQTYEDSNGNIGGTSGSGGGATSIQTSLHGDGQLKNYESVKDTDVLIVAGGGGAGNNCNYPWNAGAGGYGGGESGGNGVDIGAQDWKRNGGLDTHGGTQSYGSAFGQSIDRDNAAVGGGGGWYGGFSGGIDSSGGGSGHIGPMLANAATIAGNQSFTSPSGGTETGHTGNGYARITLVSID